MTHAAARLLEESVCLQAIEVVFLYPWAVTYNALGLYALVEMVIFLGILCFAIIYVWRKWLLWCLYLEGDAIDPP